MNKKVHCVLGVVRDLIHYLSSEMRLFKLSSVPEVTPEAGGQLMALSSAAWTLLVPPNWLSRWSLVWSFVLGYFRSFCGDLGTELVWSLTGFYSAQRGAAGCSSSVEGIIQSRISYCWIILSSSQSTKAFGFALQSPSISRVPKVTMVRMIL